MRVACLANINNMMFILCRYLRDNGIDAHLITLDDEPGHFSPEADSYDKDYLNYYTVLALTKSTIYKKDSIAILHKNLDDFDFFIGTDIAPALLTLIGKNLDVFIPHGSDIYNLPFKQAREKSVNKVWWLSEKSTLSELQKIGIENTSTILFPDEYDIHFPFKDKLKTKAQYHNTSGPMVYIPQYTDLENNPNVKELKQYDFFKNLKVENDLVVFSHSRHNGFNLGKSLAVHQKGNDILIAGFSKFAKEHTSIRSKLIFFNYGMNIEASKELIRQHKIEDHVIWMPLMQRKEIMFGLNMATISCGQFDNSWLTCGVVNETLASNIPLLHYRQDDLYLDDYNELYPLLNAKTSEDISNLLGDYIADPKFHKNKAKQGSEWLDKYTVKKPLKIILNQLNKSLDNSSTTSTDNLNRVNRILKKHTFWDKVYRLQGKIKSSLD